jgi:hypothetical protein
VLAGIDDIAEASLRLMGFETMLENETMMRICLVLLAFVAFGLSTGAGRAQSTGEEPKACVQNGATPSKDYERDSRAEWPREAQRLKSSEQLVSRQGDRLRLTIDGGKTIELIDCPFGEGANWYRYERFDPAGRFHVVRTFMLDDFSYTLVAMRTGRLLTVYGAPVWTSDKSRFLTVACSLQPQRGSLLIHAPAAEGLTTEAEIALPCETESCSARWDHSSWISVTCVPRGEPGSKGMEFVVIRSNDGAWKKFGR